MPVRRFKQNFNIVYKILSAGDYAVVFNALSSYDWSSLYNETSDNAVVDRLNDPVTKSIDLAVPYGYVKNTNNPHGFLEN
jgi:hypothetical protein